MSLTLSITESQALAALRQSYLLALFPGVSVTRGQGNRAPLPPGPNWILITPIVRARLSEPWDGISVTGSVTTASVTQNTRLDVQVDCFGPAAEDNITQIVMTWRDLYARNALAGTGVTPGYQSEPRNLTFVNDQSQYEFRWSIDLSMEVDPVATYLSQSADTLGPVDLISTQTLA